MSVFNGESDPPPPFLTLLESAGSEFAGAPAQCDIPSGRGTKDNNAVRMFESETLEAGGYNKKVRALVEGSKGVGWIFFPLAPFPGLFYSDVRWKGFL